VDIGFHRFALGREITPRFRRNRLNAEDVIDLKELERALNEKPVSAFSQRALIRLIVRALSGRADAAETRVAALITHRPPEGNKALAPRRPLSAAGPANSCQVYAEGGSGLGETLRERSKTTIIQINFK
jgi:hypothetical protein